MGSRGKYCAAALAAAIAAAIGTASAADVTTAVSGLSNPFYMATDTSGNLFIADFGTSAVYESPAPDFGTKNVLGGGPFGHPFGIAVDRQGNVFVTDASDQSVKEIPAPGYTTINTIATGFTGAGPLAVDANDNVFVLDQASRQIYELKPANYANKILLNTAPVAPFGVALDVDANLWVTSETNQSFNIVEFPAASLYQGTDIFQQPVPFPQGIAIDAQGNVFFSSQGGGVYKAVNNGSLEVSQVAGNVPGSLGIALDSRDDIFVAGGSAQVVSEIAATPLPVPALGPAAVALLSLLLSGGGWWAMLRRRTRLG